MIYILVFLFIVSAVFWGPLVLGAMAVAVISKRKSPVYLYKKNPRTGNYEWMRHE